MNTCTSFDGNSDLYGLGIRIGVYLQWISTWISLLLDPESAQTTYDINSVFVFAILVATIIAAQQGAVLIEIYLMLQFMLGSFVTTLSTLGIQKLTTRTWKSWVRELWVGSPPIIMPLKISLKGLSTWKAPGLSWSGVIWRLIIAALVASYNLAFWFDSVGNGAQQPPRQGCGPPYIFLFSKQRLEGTVFVLCRVAAIVIAVIIFPATLLLLHLMIELWWYTCLFLYRDFLYLLSPIPQQAFQSALDRINPLLEQQGIPVLATPKDKAIRFSDVIKVCVSLGTGKVTKNETETTFPMDSVGLMSGWKKASIEYTIHWNNIHSVNTINTTGQLIPFIIGCKYPDWADTRLKVEDGENGPRLLKIVKRNEAEDSGEGPYNATK
ncbi:uncharacterized protein N7482_008330 [Penicillium canariense]|uniref:Uncharacterized protein n=1 Tax=Penicillium canariense TaxID=189055 RepID=A0A9W9HW31_9EURO|nr:uncharacterized protein N7482_008330 [Penicillium canariense]KAJ5157230.1 hypothetical protein N7482_008330 [Penicillium canariense]